MSTPLQVLIADDFPDACEMYAAYLGFHGFDVVTALDGHAAVDSAVRHVPDIVLLDLRMPGLSGTDAMRILKADGRLAHVPIVALTAQTMPGDREIALQAGFDAFIAKPIDPEALVERIREILAPLRPSVEPA